MKYLNKIKKPFKRIYVIIGNICYNIKYLCTKNINIEISERLVIVDNLDVLYYDLDDKVNNLSNDIEDKCDDYQVEDIISNMVGCVDDFLTYDDEIINDIKDDLKKVGTLLEVLKDNNDLLMNKYNDTNDVDEYGNSIERSYDVLVDDIIESIINRLTQIRNIVE